MVIEKIKTFDEKILQEILLAQYKMLPYHAEVVFSFLLELLNELDWKLYLIETDTSYGPLLRSLKMKKGVGSIYFDD